MASLLVVLDSQMRNDCFLFIYIQNYELMLPGAEQLPTLWGAGDYFRFFLIFISYSQSNFTYDCESILHF